MCCKPTAVPVPLPLAAHGLRFTRTAKTFLAECGELAAQAGLSAVSVGMVDGMARLDLPYEEDARAEVDMNVVMTSDGRFVELQSTAEREAFDHRQLLKLLELAQLGLPQCVAHNSKQSGAPCPYERHRNDRRPRGRTRAME